MLCLQLLQLSLLTSLNVYFSISHQSSCWVNLALLSQNKGKVVIYLSCKTIFW